MNTSLSYSQVNDSRVRILLVAFALLAVAVSVFAADASATTILMIAVLLIASVAALTIPIGSIPVAVAMLVPFQFYFYVAGTNYALGGAFVFLIVAGLRVLIERGIRVSLRGQIWIVPFALYLSAAFVAAINAPNRYDALKGIYEWLPIVACLFIVAMTVRSARTANLTILVLVLGGVLQALLGLAEYAAGLDRVQHMLASPVSQLFFPPNLLRERLSVLSFNWVLSGNALPFGTFINGIDYAIFLAAILMLALTVAFSARSPGGVAFWLSCIVIIGLALLLTLKGSGYVAFAGGVVALAFCLVPRMSGRSLGVVIAFIVVAILASLPLAGSISDRSTFLLRRETGEFEDLSRLRIWLSFLSSYVQRPIFGYGLNNSGLLVEPMHTLRWGSAFTYNPTSPENSYVETLVETGAIGFVALMSLFGLTLARVYRKSREGTIVVVHAGVFAALVAILLGNLTVSAFTTDQNGMLMGILIGLVFAEWETQ